MARPGELGNRPYGTSEERHEVLDALEAELAELPPPMPGTCWCGRRLELRFKPFLWVDPETGEPCEHGDH